MKKKFKQKYALGSFLPQEGASDEQAALDFLKLEGLKNTGVTGVQQFGNDILSNNGFSQEEVAAFNDDMGADLAKIPGVGLWASMAKGTYNQVTGNTMNKLNNIRSKKALSNYNNIKDANAASGYIQDANVTFAYGGDFTEFQGPSHEEGGVTINAQAEVEGQETKKGDYIFSDRLKVPGKKITFAEASKRIKKMYTDKRPNDTISKNAEERELATLQDKQEIIRAEIMSNAYTKAYGGFMKKNFIYWLEFYRKVWIQ